MEDVLEKKKNVIAASPENKENKKQKVCEEETNVEVTLKDDVKKDEKKQEVEAEDEPNEVADDIASGLIKTLIEQFKQKEGKEPDEAELEALFSELTEERIAELMSSV